MSILRDNVTDFLRKKTEQNDAEPSPVRAMLLALCATAGAQTPLVSAPASPSLSTATTGKRVEDYLRSFNSVDESKMRDFFLKNVANSALQADDFSGVLMIGKNGSPIFQKAYGYANRQRKILNTWTRASISAP